MRQYLLLLLTLTFLFINSLTGFSQQLPRHMTEEEKGQMPAYIDNLQLRGGGNWETAPPASAVRSMAEWEEQDGILIRWVGTWVRPLIREIVRNAKQEGKVYIVCDDSTGIKNYLSNYSIDYNNLVFMEVPSNSIWSRDYAQWNVYTNEVDSLLFVDWIYNRPRPLDDEIPVHLADLLNIPLHRTLTAPNDLVNTGGNFFVDGWGTGFSSELVLEENEANNPYGVSAKSESDIDDIMMDYMGIDRYIKFTTLPYDGIHHIDMHMKLLDEETLLVGEYPPGVADGPQIEANIQYLQSNFNSVYGTPYEIVRIPMPPDNGQYPDSWGADYWTYTNSVIINNTVLVPIYEEQYDTTALRIYREAMPGYKIKGLDCTEIISASGAIHCITKAVGIDEPLLITHQSLDNTTNTTTPYEVNAWIKHRDGIGSAEVYYTTDTTQAYQSVNMTMTDPATDTWTGNIPAQQSGSEVFYYIHATASSGKQQVRPMPAPDGYWNFEVLQSTDVEQPKLSDFQITAFPNPADEHLFIGLSGNDPFTGELILTDVLGRELQIIASGELQKYQNYRLDVSDYSSGTYLIRLRSGAGEKVHKLLIR